MTTRIIEHPQVTWTDIVIPTEEDISALGSRYPQFHPLNLHDCLSEFEFPKLDPHEDYIFVVLHLPYYDGDERVSRRSEVDFFVAQGVFVTVHDGKLRQLNQLFETIQSDQALRDSLMQRGAAYFLHEIIQRMIAKCYPMLQRVNENIRHIEDNLFKDDTQHILREVAVTRRNIIALRHILRPQVDVTQMLESGDWAFIQRELNFYWGDIGDQLMHLRAMLDEQFEVITSLSDTIDTLAAHRMDEVLRVLTIITLLTVPLTVLSTIFGMNFEYPYAEWHVPLFLFIILVGITLTILVIWYLRRRRWL
jgi:magnesium transporter